MFWYTLSMYESTPWSTLDPATVDAPETVHACLVALAKDRAVGDFQLCRWLLRADELRLERCHGSRPYANTRSGSSASPAAGWRTGSGWPARCGIFPV